MVWVHTVIANFNFPFTRRKIGLHIMHNCILYSRFYGMLNTYLLGCITRRNRICDQGAIGFNYQLGCGCI